MQTSALVVLSGGQDSTTCLYWAKQKFDVVHTLTFNYGQKHEVEVLSAWKIAAMAGAATHERVIIPEILKGTSPLVNPEYAVEAYASAEVLPGGLEKTFVPCRNLLFLTIAANRAVALGCSDIVTGVCEEDFGGYPDCRRVFIDSLEDTLEKALEHRLTIHTPLMHLTKAQTVELAEGIPGCREALAYSHTCYNGQVPPCGTCHACLLRERGYREAGVKDPLIIRCQEEGLYDKRG